MTMTRDEIMRLSGRDLDVQVAIAVDGWQWASDETFVGWHITLAQVRIQGRAIGPDGLPHTVQRYSTDIAAAFDALHQRPTAGRFRLTHVTTTEWRAYLGVIPAQGDTAAQAICRAVLCDVEGV